MVEFCSAAIGFGFGMAFLCDAYRGLTMWWLSYMRKVS